MKVPAAGKRKTEESTPFAGGSRGGASSAGRVDPLRETFADVAYDIEARALLDELDRIGAQLSRFPTGHLMASYRELVRMALQQVKKNSQMRREYKWRRTERAMYVIIERTEGALLEMDEALLREGERTRLLSLMEEIKGCLISLLF